MGKKYQRGTGLRYCPSSCEYLRVDEYPFGADLSCLVSSGERCIREHIQQSREAYIASLDVFLRHAYELLEED